MEEESYHSSQGGSKPFEILWKAGHHVAKSMTSTNLIGTYSVKQTSPSKSPSHRKTSGKYKEKSAHKVRSTHAPISPRKKQLVGNKSPGRRFIRPMQRRQELARSADDSKNSQRDFNKDLDCYEPNGEDSKHWCGKTVRMERRVYGLA